MDLVDLSHADPALFDEVRRVGKRGASTYPDRRSGGLGISKATLALALPTADIVPGEAGGGQVPRQPGQVRKEAAVTSSDLGRPSGLPCLDTVRQ